MSPSSTTARTDTIIEVIREAFAPLMRADPVAFRAKYRKMALDPHAFYRGSACLFYSDVTQEPDDWSATGAERIWIHGDLHVENFGTYLNSDGRLIFDVNDFDEAYLGRFVVGPAALRRQPGADRLAEGAARGRGAQADRPLPARPTSSQVDHYAGTEEDDDFALHLENADGPVLVALERRAGAAARRPARRGDGADQGDARRFTEDDTARRLGREERTKVVAAFRDYLDTIPTPSASTATLFYELRDVVGKSGFGIGSAGLPAYNILVEGYSQALDNDVVLSMKQANVPAVSRFVDTSRRGRLLRARGAPDRGQPARAAGAHRPAARPHQTSTASATS